MKLSPVKEAACRHDGVIYTGKRHGNIILHMVSLGYKKVLQKDQVFVTEDGEFLSRSEAYERAVLCGQIRDDKQTRILVSEMLY